MREYYTVVGNTEPLIGIQLYRKNSGPIDLVEDEVDQENIELILKRFSTQDQTNAGHETVSIVSAVNGTVTYDPEATDFPVEGFYIGSAVLHYQNGGVEYLYDQLLVLARAK